MSSNAAAEGLEHLRRRMCSGAAHDKQIKQEHRGICSCHGAWSCCAAREFATAALTSNSNTPRPGLSRAGRVAWAGCVRMWPRLLAVVFIYEGPQKISTLSTIQVLQSLCMSIRVGRVRRDWDGFWSASAGRWVMTKGTHALDRACWRDLYHVLYHFWQNRFGSLACRVL